MALKSTIYKFDLQVSDFDKEHYQQYPLSVALHPSEKVERMLLRVAVFSFFANESLQFTKGLSTDEEPDLWQKTLSDELELWIELGLPDERRIKKGLSVAPKVVVVAYGGQKIELWLQALRKAKLDMSKIEVYIVDIEPLAALASTLSRTAHIDSMIQDRQLTLTINDSSAVLSMELAVL